MPYSVFFFFFCCLWWSSPSGIQCVGTWLNVSNNYLTNTLIIDYSQCAQLLKYFLLSSVQPFGVSASLLRFFLLPYQPAGSDPACSVSPLSLHERLLYIARSLSLSLSLSLSTFSLPSSSTTIINSYIRCFSSIIYFHSWWQVYI